MKFTLDSLTDPKQALKWTLFHVALGIASSYFKYAFIAYFYWICYVNLVPSFKELRKGNLEPFSITMAYLLGMELMNRIVEGSPFVPVEYSKYFSVFIWGYAAFMARTPFNSLGIAMLIFAIPGALYDRSDQVYWYDIVNNYLAPVGLAIGVGLWGSCRPSEKMISQSMRLIWLSSIAVLACIIIRTPKFEDISFSLSANESTTGGTSSNQASTILGLGMFLSYFSFYRKEEFSGRRYLDLIAMLAFAVQGLLTFSRGGVMVGALGILVLMFSPVKSTAAADGKGGNTGGMLKNLSLLLLGSAFLILSFLVVDTITNGLLTLRYLGETSGTVGGYAEKDLNKITSGRAQVFSDDMEIWREYPILGAGAGSSPYLRMQKGGVWIAPHVEISRLLAEQGIPGLLYFLLLIWIGFLIFRRRNQLLYSDLLLAIYFIGFASSFHAAMRTFVTPFFIAFSSMAISTLQNRKESNP